MRSMAGGGGPTPTARGRGRKQVDGSASWGGAVRDARGGGSAGWLHTIVPVNSPLLRLWRLRLLVLPLLLVAVVVPHVAHRVVRSRRGGGLAGRGGVRKEFARAGHALGHGSLLGHPSLEELREKGRGAKGGRRREVGRQEGDTGGSQSREGGRGGHTGAAVPSSCSCRGWQRCAPRREAGLKTAHRSLACAARTEGRTRARCQRRAESLKHA